MKKKILFIVLALVLILAILPGCVPDEPVDVVPEQQTPGAATNVRSKWVDGNLDFQQKDGTSILKLDGTNGDTEIAEATITAGTATAYTITTLGSTTGTIANLTSTTANITNLGPNTSLTIAGPTITSPTITGTGTITATTANITNIGPSTTLTIVGPTITGPAITGTSTIGNGMTITTPAITSPTITGTSIVANRQSGLSGNLTGGLASVVVTHGMTGTPTRIFLTFAANPGVTTVPLYSSSINSTMFTITANTTESVKVYWLALVADE